ncbi:hypothetical protein [Flagellimonas sp. 2504JD4-2]
MHLNYSFIKKKNTVIGFILITIFFQSNAQTPGPFEIGQASSGATLLVGRQDGNPSIKASSQGTGHLILDSNFGQYVSLNHYNSDNIVLALGGGKTGVGINQPKSRLHVYNGASGRVPHGIADLAVEDDENVMLSLMTYNTRTAYYGFADSDDDFVGGIQYSHPSDAMYFRVNNHSSDMIINKHGNVGIGTTNPGGYRLAVNGNIHTKEVKVDLTGWSDFVFNQDYLLPTLTEVEKHIKEKGHLKDIPSAKEVLKNGVLLGEMDAKLLQKIEELTLYTIQQEKKLDMQSQEIEKLKSLVTNLLESTN